MDAAATLRYALRESMRMNGDQIKGAPVQPEHRRRAEDDDEDRLAAVVAHGVRDGIAAVMKDEELIKAFWREGYLHLSENASTGASQWVGKRILIAAIAAVFVWTMGWLFRNGAFK